MLLANHLYNTFMKTHKPNKNMKHKPDSGAFLLCPDCAASKKQKAERLANAELIFAFAQLCGKLPGNTGGLEIPVFDENKQK